MKNQERRDYTSKGLGEKTTAQLISDNQVVYLPPLKLLKVVPCLEFAPLRRALANYLGELEKGRKGS